MHPLEGSSLLSVSAVDLIEISLPFAVCDCIVLFGERELFANCSLVVSVGQLELMII